MFDPESFIVASAFALLHNIVKIYLFSISRKYHIIIISNIILIIASSLLLLISTSISLYITRTIKNCKRTFPLCITSKVRDRSCRRNFIYSSLKISFKKMIYSSHIHIYSLKGRGTLLTITLNFLNFFCYENCIHVSKYKKPFLYGWGTVLSNAIRRVINFPLNR